MKAAPIGAGAIAGLWVLHLPALWMEEREWIYYGRKQGTAGAAGAAALELQKIIQPETRHVIEAKRPPRKKADGQGEGKPDR